MLLCMWLNQDHELVKCEHLAICGYMLCNVCNKNHKIQSSWYGKQPARTLPTWVSWGIARRQAFWNREQFPIVKGSLGSNIGWWKISSFSLFWHNKINAIVNEEFMCLKVKINWLATLFCKDVSTGKKKTYKKIPVGNFGDKLCKLKSNKDHGCPQRKMWEAVSHSRKK